MGPQDVFWQEGYAPSHSLGSASFLALAAIPGEDKASITSKTAETDFIEASFVVENCRNYT